MNDGRAAVTMRHLVTCRTDYPKKSRPAAEQAVEREDRAHGDARNETHSQGLLNRQTHVGHAAEIPPDDPVTEHRETDGGDKAKQNRRNPTAQLRRTGEQ